MTSTSEPDDGTTRNTTSRILSIAAAVSIVIAGLSVTAYAFLGFPTPNWTFGAPGLLVAAAGVAGLRYRWLYLAGLAPLVAILGVAGQVLAYDLARPDETSYFLGSALTIVSGSLAAGLGVAAAFGANGWQLPAASVVSLAAIPILFWSVIGSNPASAADDDTSTAERESAVDVELVDYFFVVDPELLAGDEVVHLRNTGTFPHNFVIEDLDVAVFVPPGRDTFLRMPEPEESITLICTIGNHLELGMRLDVPASYP